MQLRMVDVRRAVRPHPGRSTRRCSRSSVRANSSAALPCGPSPGSLADWLGHTWRASPVHVIPCANGTDALQAAFMALGIGPGDEVITPSFTFISTVEILHLLRITPVMVERGSRAPSPWTRLRWPRRSPPKTEAILPVHLYGQCADMTALRALAAQHKLALVEDTAQAIGSSWETSPGHWEQAGTMGTIGTTSFFPSKNLGAYGDGGACFTRDAALAEQLRMICQPHGSRRRYEHEIIGMNSRLDSIQAAILNVKLPHLNGYNAARRGAQTAACLLGGHPLIATPYRHPKSHHVFHQYTLRFNTKERGRDFGTTWRTTSERKASHLGCTTRNPFTSSPPLPMWPPPLETSLSPTI